MALVGWSDLGGNGGLKIQRQSAENQRGTDGYWFGLMGDTHHSQQSHILSKWVIASDRTIDIHIQTNKIYQSPI